MHSEIIRGDNYILRVGTASAAAAAASAASSASTVAAAIMVIFGDRGASYQSNRNE